MIVEIFIFYLAMGSPQIGIMLQIKDKNGNWIDVKIARELRAMIIINLQVTFIHKTLKIYLRLIPLLPLSFSLHSCVCVWLYFERAQNLDSSVVELSLSSDHSQRGSGCNFLICMCQDKSET